QLASFYVNEYLQGIRECNFFIIARQTGGGDKTARGCLAIVDAYFKMLLLCQVSPTKAPKFYRKGSADEGGAETHFAGQLPVVRLWKAAPFVYVSPKRLREVDRCYAGYRQLKAKARARKTKFPAAVRFWHGLQAA